MLPPLNGAPISRALLCGHCGQRWVCVCVCVWERPLVPMKINDRRRIFATTRASSFSHRRHSNQIVKGNKKEIKSWHSIWLSLVILSGPSSSPFANANVCCCCCCRSSARSSSSNCEKWKEEKESLRGFSLFLSPSRSLLRTRIKGWQIEQSNYQWCNRSSSGKPWVVLINGRLLNKGKARRAALMKFMTLTQAQNREVLPVLASFSWAHRAKNPMPGTGWDSRKKW